MTILIDLPMWRVDTILRTLTIRGTFHVIYLEPIGGMHAGIEHERVESSRSVVATSGVDLNFKVRVVAHG